MPTLNGTTGADNIDESAQTVAYLIKGDAGSTTVGGNDTLYGGSAADTINGDLGDDQLHGQAGNDSLAGGGGADYLYGGVGNDTLTGSLGNDYLSGDAGSDTYQFAKGDGQDTISNYAYQDTGATDTIQLVGLNTTDIMARRDSNDLLITINGTNDSLRVSSYFYQDGVSDYGYSVNQIKFANGTTWNLAQVKAEVIKPTLEADYLLGYESNDTLAGQDGNDTLYGRGGNDNLDGGTNNDQLYGEVGNDSLIGGSGADYLYGGVGNDTLSGGLGNDYLSGDAGSDTYQFAKGDGQDTISNYAYADTGATDTIQLTGINPAAVTARRDSNDLLITINGTGDSLRVSSYFYQDGVSDYGYAINQINFADGTSWNLAQVKAEVLKPTLEADYLLGYESNDTLAGQDGNDTLYGRGGNDNLDGGTNNDQLYGEVGNDSLIGGRGADTLYGGVGNDTLTGGLGNDYLSGDAGSDTYQFSIGDGQDTISNYVYQDTGATDTIQLVGINPADVTARRDSNDLLITINGTSDSLRVSSYFYQDGVSDYGYAVNQIKFANGTSWNLAQVKAEVIKPTLEADYLLGYESNDTLAGQDGNDTLYGRGGNDKLDGGTNNDQLYGEVGNDSLIGGSGADTLYGGVGNDTLTGGLGNDYLSGDAGSDTYQFAKGDGQDTISNYAYQDTGSTDVIQLTGLNPADVVMRRDSNDLLITVKTTGDSLRVSSYFYLNGVSDYGYAVNQIKFANGTSWNYASVNSNLDTSVPPASTTLNGNANAEALTGGAGNDTLYGNGGNDTLTGGAGNDYLSGGDGNDVYVFGKGSGQDTIYTYDAAAGKVDTLKLTALNASDITVKLDGNDLLILVNGTNDRARIQNFYSATTSAYQLDKILFADGTSWNTATINAKLLLGTTEGDYLYGYASNDSISGLGGNDTLYGVAGNDTLDGGAGADVLYSDAGDDSLLGGSGNDTLYGSAGNDTLDGGAGNDYLSGDAGNDVYVFGKGSGQDTIYTYDATAGKVDTLKLTALNATDITVKLDGNDLLVLVNGTSYSARIQNFYSATTSAYQLDKILFADGTSWDTATISARLLQATPEGDYLYGYASNDSISGLGGNDTLYGVAGNDTLDGGAGSDILYSDDGNDSLLGGSGNDTLYGAVGNDTLDGGAGNDYLDGGAGNDVFVLAKGSGQDTIYTYDATSGKVDTLKLTALNAADITVKLDGNDLLVLINGTGDSARIQNFYSATTSAYQLDKILFADGTSWNTATIKAKLLLGTTESDYLYGYASNDSISGLGGSDTLYGAAGNDTLDGGASSDWLYGDEGNDKLLGGSGNDTLYGVNGNDSLDGGAGNDYLDGGAGNDVYTVDSTRDVVTEGLSAGTDTVNSSVTYTLSANVEKLILTGSAAINGTGNGVDSTTLTGNTGNNILTGGTGNDAISGGAGADTLIGGAGNDTYTVDNIGDVITEGLSAGTDAVNSSVTYTLSANVEKLTLTGTAAINGIGNGVTSTTLTGNTGNNVLTGGSGTDTLNGGVGSDTLIGGTGNDTYTVDNIGDVVTEGLSAGTDAVNASITYTLSANVEKLTLTGTTAINGTGNILANTLTGNTANNILTGGAGNDTITGGLGLDTLNGGTGNDSLVGGSGNDVYQFALGDGIDTVSDVDTTAGNLDQAVVSDSVHQAQIALFKNGNNLQIGYVGNTTDLITVKSQFVTGNSVEKLASQDTGKFLTNTDINTIIANMSAYATDHGITLSSIETVKNNAGLLAIVNTGWHG